MAIDIPVRLEVTGEMRVRRPATGRKKTRRTPAPPKDDAPLAKRRGEWVARVAVTKGEDS